MGGQQTTARLSRAQARAADRAPARIQARAQHLSGREVVIEPGGCTGWHFHEVPLIALVRSGTLTRILHDDTVVVHRAGDNFVEPPGIEHVHLGRNLGTDPVVLYVTSTLAEGDAFSIPAEAPPGAAPCPCPGCLPRTPGGRPAAHTRRRISPRTR
ncbi:cupin domain-containing protein [Streptomyces sp. NPDC006326]|uniref:cupin domain-containing protein n=1 Tax=Streptomyces sp. NPDC006326 TaxID=3156752 RepID=UPI0033A30A78